MNATEVYALQQARTEFAYLACRTDFANEDRERWRALKELLDDAIVTEEQKPRTKKHDGPCWRQSHSDCGC